MGDQAGKTSSEFDGACREYVTGVLELLEGLTFDSPHIRMSPSSFARELEAAFVAGSKFSLDNITTSLAEGRSLDGLRSENPEAPEDIFGICKTSEHPADDEWGI